MCECVCLNYLRSPSSKDRGGKKIFVYVSVIAFFFLVIQPTKRTRMRVELSERPSTPGRVTCLEFKVGTRIAKAGNAAF